MLGPVVSLKIMGTQYVVLSSFKTTKDLLEKKSATTSNRPHLTMGGDLVGWRDTTAFLQYGDTCRKHRKFFGRQIGTKSSLEVFYAAEEVEARRFLRNVLKNTDDLVALSHRCIEYGAVCARVIVLIYHIFCRMASSMILKISHGYTVKEDGDPFVEMANKVMNIFNEITAPGRYLVDIFPICTFSEFLRSASLA